jgi:hypothetical protein
VPGQAIIFECIEYLKEISKVFFSRVQWEPAPCLPQVQNSTASNFRVQTLPFSEFYVKKKLEMSDLKGLGKKV